MGRLEKLVSADTQIRRQYSALTSKITAEFAALETLRQKLTDANGAHDRALQLLQDREAAYQRAFEAIIAEQTVLKELYRPLMERLRAASGTLQNLSFSVERVADVQRWATEAEDDLIDLRKQGSFKGKGTLFQRANEVLRTAWEQGSATDVSAAMREFRLIRMSYWSIRPFHDRTRPNSGRGQNALRSGCLALNTSKSDMALSMMALIFANCRPARAASSYCCSILHSMMPMTGRLSLISQRRI